MERDNAEGHRPKPRHVAPPRSAVRLRRLALILWCLVAFVVWNGVFDLLVTRGVKEYLYREAEADLGRRPRTSMRGIMDQTIHDAAITASLWAIFVGGAGVVAVYGVTGTSPTAGGNRGS